MVSGDMKAFGRDQDIQYRCCWAVSSLVSTDPGRAKKALEVGVAERVVSCTKQFEGDTDMYFHISKTLTSLSYCSSNVHEFQRQGI